MTKVYMYLRVSTQVQTEKFGIELQKTEIEKYCSENNIEIVDTFIDNGITGTIIDRDGLQDMIKSLKESEDVKDVIVLNCSRLWRDDTIGGVIRYELMKNKCNIISVQEPTYSLYTTNASEYLINSIMQSLAIYERLQINTKLSTARRVKAKGGDKPAGNVPFGYKWDNAKVIVDYNNHIVIKEIFKYYAEDKSYSKVKRYCDSRDYRTSTGKLFSVQAIKNIIHNDFYIGIVTHSGKKTQGNHEPIIVDRELFESCQ